MSGIRSEGVGVIEELNLAKSGEPGLKGQSDGRPKFQLPARVAQNPKRFRAGRSDCSKRKKLPESPPTLSERSLGSDWLGQLLRNAVALSGDYWPSTFTNHVPARVARTAHTSFPPQLNNSLNLTGGH